MQYFSKLSFLWSGITLNFQMCILLFFLCVQIRPCIALHDISFTLSLVYCFSLSLPCGSAAVIHRIQHVFSFCDPVSSKSGNKFFVLLLVHWIYFVYFILFILFFLSESVLNKAWFRRNSGTFSHHFTVFLTSESSQGPNLHGYKIHVLVILYCVFLYWCWNLISELFSSYCAHLS